MHWMFYKKYFGYHHLILDKDCYEALIFLLHIFQTISLDDVNELQSNSNSINVYQ
jgi:hypothetical protein